ncbi:alanine racemase [Acerihabitans sp.]|uniref:alanine racemase n=1 Tax=Acerihabitans sp. TaxID=2811394 RepID=UPI002ED824B6
MLNEMDPGFIRPWRDDRRTPFIEIDAWRLERNLQRMQQKAAAAGVALRPHVKTHKSLDIAHRQLALGAVGITVSKPSEGVVFIRGGVRDVLLAYPVIRAATLEPLLAEAKRHQARVTLITADAAGVEAIAQAARVQNMPDLGVYIKIDVGLGRVGVSATGAAPLRLATALQQHGLRFAGLLSHAGHAYSAGSAIELAQLAAAEARLLLAARQRLAQAGFPACALSTGATPTALGAPIAAGLDEIRPGNYALLDLTGVRLGICRPDDMAMTVVARVVAVNDDYAIVDAGSKALSSDLGPHGTGGSGWGIAVNQHLPLTYQVIKLSEEHGFILHNGVKPEIGSLMRIFPNHACAVMAMFDEYVLRDDAYNGKRVAIEARGQFT